MNTVKITASVSETIKDYASIVEVFGQGCNYRTKFGVSGLIVLISAEVEMNDETHLFDCQYETEDRNDSIRAYNGVDMQSSYDYGEQSELFAMIEEIDFSSTQVFINDTQINDVEALQKYLVDLAKDECLEFFLENIVDILDYEDIQEKIIKEFKKYENYHLFDDNQIQELIYEECYNALKGEYFNIVDTNQFDCAVSDNEVFYDLVRQAQDIAEEKYLEMGETGLSDEELLENLDIDLVFINIFERALEDVDVLNTKKIYISFYAQLYKLLHNTNTEVNVWHVEQNEMKTNLERKSAKELCYLATINLINDFKAA